MVFTHVLISNPLLTVPSTLITIGITVTVMFHRLFSSLARSRYSSLFSVSFIFTLWSTRMANPLLRRFCFFFLVTITRSCRLAGICVLKSQRSLCVLFSKTDSVLRIYHLFIKCHKTISNQTNQMYLPTIRFGWLVVWVLWYINLCRLFNAKSVLYKNNHFYFKKFSLAYENSFISNNSV